jgi:2'-5' RNA ligase
MGNSQIYLKEYDEIQKCINFNFNFISDIEKKNIIMNHLHLLKRDVNDFIPMRPQDIHVTAVFIGNENFDEIETYAVLNHIRINETIQFDGFDLFGPNRDYLVAKYKCSHELQVLVAKIYTDLNLHQRYEYCPHITVGKIKNEALHQEEYDSLKPGKMFKNTCQFRQYA